MESKHKNNKVSAKEFSTFSNTIVVGVDGGEGSHNAVEVIVKDFHRRGVDKLIVVHISNEKKEHEKGLQYHSKTIYNTYSEFLSKALNTEDYEIIFENRKENENVFEQINAIATSKKANLLVVGFRGYKGAKNRPDDLSKGIAYLVHKPLIPVLVIKEKTHREFRTELGFKFLFCIESNDSKSFNSFNHALRYIDAENDTIQGLTVDAGSSDCGKIEASFKEICAKNEIKNVEFTVIKKDDKSIKSTIHDWVEDHLKKENHFIDFICLGYNAVKYNFNKEAENTTVDIIKTLNCNVFFDH